MGRPGWSPSVFLRPFHENIAVGPAIVYKSGLAVFGMGSALPLYVLSIGLFVASGALLFVYLRRRVGDWAALLAAVLLLFLGAAFEDLLWAFQIGYFGSVAAGLGMLVALDREDAVGDRVACALLAVSLAFSSLGLAFALGAFVAVLLGGGPRGNRLFLPLLPLGLFALWWIGWGHDAESHLSVDNLVHVPKFVFESAAAGFTSIFGLATGDGSEPNQPHLIWGKLALLVALALLGARLVRERRLSPGLAVVLAIGLSFWVLAGVNRSPERFPTSSRYQYPSAVFILLIAGEALRRVRIPRPALAVAAAIGALSIYGGVSLAQREYRDRWRPTTRAIESSLAGVEIAGPAAQPDFPVAFPPAVTVSARTYLEAADRYGSPALSEPQLRERPEEERAATDLTIAQAVGLALQPPPPGSPIRCQLLRASSAGHTGLTLLRGSFRLRNDSAQPVEVMLRRFASDFSVSLGPVEPGQATSLRIPIDGGKRPWALGLVGAGDVQLCSLPG